MSACMHVHDCECSFYVTLLTGIITLLWLNAYMSFSGDIEYTCMRQVQECFNLRGIAENNGGSEKAGIAEDGRFGL